jgi:hypothetical protein
MKIRFALSILALVLLVPIAPSRASETINMDVVANVDRFGDGSMKITFHLSAKQWAIWKEQYGDHPDVLWRDMKQLFAKYALDKFDLQKNEIDRTAVVNIDAHAFTHVRGDGTRGIEIPKEFRLVSNNGREWIFNFTSQQSPYSPILTQTNKIILPEEAKNARLDQPGTGSEQLVYEIPENLGFGRVILGLGLLSILGSLLFGIFALIFLFKRPVTPPVVPAR